MKKRLTSILALVMALMLCLAACGGKTDEGNKGNEGNTGNTGNAGNTASTETTLDGTYDITVWVSEVDGMKELTQAQIDKFEAENPGIVINAVVEGVSEAESATQMINSVEDGADIFCFAQDQLSRLVMAGALNKLGTQTAATVKELNDAGAVKAASVGGELYCYPLTSDNGYYMYYDKSVVKPESIDSLEAVIADCEAAGRLFSFEMETSGWYNIAFMFATGCVSEWTTDADANFVSVNDTFNSEAGLIALKGMQKLLKSPAYNSSSAGADFAAAVPSAVVVSGTWAANDVKAALGDNYAAADLPSFEVDGKSYHLASFSGNKLMGVKPQVDAKKGAVLQKLALYLTGEACQLERFNQFGWGPSNLKAQATDAVKNDPALSALAAQSAYATPQGNIHGSWWDISKVYAVAAKSATTDEELKAALQAYEDSINGLFSMSDEVKNAYTVIGTVNGTNWDMDFAMENNDGVWTTVDTFDLTAGMEFKVRQGLNWDIAFPAANYVVETDGKYKIQLTVHGENGTVELIPQ